jgi:hypothetical protein
MAHQTAIHSLALEEQGVMTLWWAAHSNSSHRTQWNLATIMNTIASNTLKNPSLTHIHRVLQVCGTRTRRRRPNPEAIVLPQKIPGSRLLDWGWRRRGRWCSSGVGASCWRYRWARAVVWGLWYCSGWIRTERGRRRTRYWWNACRIRRHPISS